VEKDKVKISVVSYLNSIPFVNGLEKAFNEQLVISKDIPSECAAKLIDGRVDIGLIPIAMINKVTNAEIISDYCIAGNGKVASVLLVSNNPIEDIKTIYQDYQSRTSVALAKILMRDYWKKEVDWKQENEDFLHPKDSEALVIIGDRALKNYHQYKYVYDLSEAWKNHTGLPFVFACWVSNKKISSELIHFLNSAFKNSILEIDNYCDTIITESDITGRDYLTKYIQYHLTDEARKGMNLFLDLMKLL
jgi:chorismate dehydratase